MFYAQGVNPCQSFPNTTPQYMAGAAAAAVPHLQQKIVSQQAAAESPASRLYAYARIKVREPKWMSYDLLVTHYHVNMATRLSGVFPEFIFHAELPREIETVPTGSSLVEAVTQLESRATVSKRTGWKVTCYPILHPHRTYIMSGEEVAAHGLHSDSKVSELTVYNSFVFNVVPQAQQYRVEVIARQRMDVVHFLGLKLGEPRVFSEADIALLGLSFRKWKLAPCAEKSSLPYLKPYSFVLERIGFAEGVSISVSTNERVYYTVTMRLDSKVNKKSLSIPEENTTPCKARSTSCLPPLQDSVSLSLPPRLRTIPELRRAHSMIRLDASGAHVVGV
ncbi:MAG: hypothetical protein JSS62_05800 [Verrucomicrobia bacterium]|nr:hypothetical protein [Verrucomicrobiota bacterium]MBS0647137.1 hypothetical protein [Verrucomicrobiota bacterium]